MLFRPVSFFLLAGAGWRIPARAQDGPIVPAGETVPIRGGAELILPASPRALQALPSRPESHVLDEMGLLSPAAQTGLAKKLIAAAAHGLSLYWIAPRSGEGLPGNAPAGTLARLWEEEPVTVVLLQVAGQPLETGTSASRLSSIQQDEIAALVQLSLAAGRARSDPAEQGPVAARHLMAAFSRYRAGIPLTADSPSLVAKQAADRRHKQRLFAGGAAILGLLALLLYLRHRRSRRPRLFPFTVARERFSAPHSGGNNAMSSFARETNREQR